MKNNKKLMFILSLLLISIAFIGCQPRTPQKPNMDNQDRLENRLTTERRNQNRVPNNNRIPNNNRVPTNPNNDRVNDTDIGQNNMDNDLINNNNRRTMSTRHERLTRRINELNGVKSSTVVLSGNTALVGVDIDRNLEGKLTDDLKRKIERIIKDTDENIENVGITADPDIFKRISNMARDIGDGEPITGFGKEIEEIFRRIVPGK